MITIEGHTFRPEALTYISPVENAVYPARETTRYYILLIIGGQPVRIELDRKEQVERLRNKLITDLFAATAAYHGV